MNENNKPKNIGKKLPKNIFGNFLVKYKLNWMHNFKFVLELCGQTNLAKHFRKISLWTRQKNLSGVRPAGWEPERSRGEEKPYNVCHISGKRLTSQTQSNFETCRVLARRKLRNSWDRIWFFRASLSIVTYEAQKSWLVANVAITAMKEVPPL
jgi:hypothetical protein